MEASRVSLPERYRFDAVLGRGGMGIVYAAFDLKQRREVALKSLSPERRSSLEPKLATALLEREFHTLSQLAHPHIIEVYDYGVGPGGAYYTMERLHGVPLRDAGVLPVKRACLLIRDIASALALLHSRRLVHRDVTPLNIQLTHSGRAKLIDFGAMVPFGVPKDVVGTPAFIAPECLNALALDGQADLFSLGACLYYALTGHQAYPTNHIQMLREAWQHHPPSPSQLVSGIPAALDSLVLEMLSLAQFARPRSAADVFERLTSIANLPPVEAEEVARAYLSKPALVGRDQQLQAARSAATKALRGAGSTLLVEGASGTGRSRMLDEAVLEATLCGARVARASAREHHGTPFGVALDLLRAMAPQTPDAVSVNTVSAIRDNDERERVTRELTQSLLAACDSSAWAIAVDDLDALDAASLAVIASLSLELDARRLLILATVDKATHASALASLNVLRMRASRLALAELDLTTTRALLSSIFGEILNLDLLSRLVHGSSHGNPRALMDSAQRLIDLNLLRYEVGSWLCSGDTDALSAALSGSSNVEARLRMLSDDARELVEALALDEYSVLSLPDYPGLTAHRDSSRMHRALVELQGAQLVTNLDDRVRFVREAERRGIVEQLSSQRRRALHERLAECCIEEKVFPLHIGHHFVHAGLPERAISPMIEVSALIESHAYPDELGHPLMLDTLEALAEATDIPGTHPSFRTNQLSRIVLNGMYRGLPERVVSRLAETIRGLEDITGITDYRVLSHLGIPERLTEALRRADERCRQPGLDGMDLLQAIRRLSQVCVTTTVCASFMADPSLLDLISDLTPLAPLSPVLAVAIRVIEAVSMNVRGQTWRAWDALEAVRLELHSPALKSVDPLSLVVLKRIALGYLCALEGEHAALHTLEHLDEYSPVARDLAESQRARYYLACGDPTRAAAARRVFEALSVQHNALSDARNTELMAYLNVYALCDDLGGLRRCLASMQPLAASRPMWRGRVALASAHVLRCRGKLEDALAVLTPAIAWLPRAHHDFGPCAAAHIELLNGARLWREACEVGHAHLEQAVAHGIPGYRIELALARCHAALGEHDTAERYYNDALQALQKRGAGGVLLGQCYETGAIVALERGDVDAFGPRAEACAGLYDAGRNPNLISRSVALMRRAADGGGRTSPRDDTALERTSELAAELALCLQSTESPAFYEELLKLCVRRANANGGALYVATEGDLQFVASIGECAVTLNDLRQADGSLDSDTTVAIIDDESIPTAPAAETPAMAPATTYLLEHDRDGPRTREGVVVLVSAASTQLPRLSMAEIRAFADCLRARRADPRSTNH